MSSRAKSFHTSCLRKVWLKASWLFVKYFFAKTDPVWIISSQYRSAWVFLSGAQSSLRKSIEFRICQHRTNYIVGHNGRNVIFWNQQSFHQNTQSSSERHDNCWSVVEADMRFVKKFTWPDFSAKNFTHLKCVNCDNFYWKRNSVNALISVILVDFLLCKIWTVSVQNHTRCV